MGRSTIRRGPRRVLLGLGSLAAAALLAACGSGGTHFADLPRPPLPENLTVYVDNNHVAVSPDHIGGGPVTLLVTNEATGTETVKLQRTGGTGGTRASGDGTTGKSTGAIDSDTTADIQTNLSEGVYAISAGPKILPARLSIGRERQNADNALLQP